MAGALISLLGSHPQTAGVTYPVTTSTVSSTFIFPNLQYSCSSVCYVGPDTSSRPVFAVASGSSGNLRVTLFRVNSDTTITEGSVQTAAVTNINQQVSMASEYEDANVNGAGTGDYAYLTYSATGASYARVIQVSRDALTVTFGTAVSLALTPDAQQNYVAYVGNSRSVHGARTGSGAVAKRYSRSGTTLTAEGTATGDMGFRIDSDLIGFVNNGTTQYRYGWFNTQSGASGTHYGAGEMGSTNYLASNTAITSSNYDQGSTLNSYNKMIGLNRISSTWYVRAVNITWNAASAATLSAGSSQSFTDVTGSGGQAYVIHGHQFDEAYVLYASSTSTIDYRRITVDGTTTTLGSKVTGVTGLSSLYYQLAATSARIGVDRWIAGYYVRSSGNPYLFAMKLQPYTRSFRTVVPFGNAQVDTAQSKFGGASALFDGTGDYLLAAYDADTVRWNNHTNYTIEFWVRPNSMSNFETGTGTKLATTIGQSTPTSTTSYWNFGPLNDGSVRWFYWTGAEQFITTTGVTLTTGNWYHLAMVKTGTDLKIYVDGTERASGTVTGTPQFGTNDLSIGSHNNISINAWLDEIRISKTNRYTANFTPSTTAFVNDADTLLLIHADGTDASTAFTDDAA